MSRTLKAAVAMLLLAMVLVSASGCGAAAGDPLEGTSWRLTGWTVSSIDPSSVTITAEFKEGQIGGNSGVNSYGAPYATGANGALTIGTITSTLIAGPEPAMRAETAYDALLAKVASFKIDGNTLALLDASGNQSLIFTARAK